MPSKSKKQLNLFKIVKAYVDNGPNGLMSAWKEIYPNRKANRGEIKKIIDIASKIDYADLEDLSSGIDGEEILGSKLDIRVGYWMRFNAIYSDYKGEKKESILIAKIKTISPINKIVNFNSEDIYNKNGHKIAPLRRVKILDTNRMWLDYAYYDQILETGKTIESVVMKNEIRKIIRNILFEDDAQSLASLKKLNDKETVQAKVGMKVQKKSDESRGEVIEAITDNETTPASLKLKIKWTSGDLSGTEQTVDFDDVYAL
jgi:hypothetical protein